MQCLKTVVKYNVEFTFWVIPKTQSILLYYHYNDFEGCDIFQTEKDANDFIDLTFGTEG